MMHTKLQFSSSSANYPIHIGSNLLGNKELFLPYVSSDEVAIVTSDNIPKQYLQTVSKIFPNHKLISIVLPDGEKHKCIDTLNIIFTKLLEKNFSRQSTLIALGGGVVGDMVGFAAACYKRGINFIQVPTTLLAQVDSSVGGKTGVNHALGKNMIGAFYQPVNVVIDIDTLKTLPIREYKSGFAEIVKYGMLYDAEFFSYLERNLDNILNKNSETLQQIIFRCCQIKAKIVAKDEKETDGKNRILLNLGHTFGHAIETVSQYKVYLHGEAIAVGLVLASYLSNQLGHITVDTHNRVVAFLENLGLPVSIPSVYKVEDLYAAMLKDKKNTSSKIKLVLLKELGRAFVRDDVAESLIKQVWEVVINSA